MRKNMFYMVGMLLFGAMLTACSGDDETANDVNQQSLKNKKVILKGTLSEDETTRSSVKVSTGIATWSNGDQIAVRYQKTDGTWDKAIATVSAGGNTSATFTAELTDPADCTVQLVHPAERYQDTELGYSTDYLANQNGEKGYQLNRVFTASSSMNINGDVATLGSNVTLECQTPVFFLYLKSNSDNADLVAKELVISDGTNTYTITQEEASNLFGFCLPPTTGATFTFTAKCASYTQKAGVTLSNCTFANIGDVFDKDGNIYSCSNYDNVYSATFNNITLEKGKWYRQNLALNGDNNDVHPVGMIAYVGENGTVDASSSDTQTGYRGMALALTDCSSFNTGTGNWDPDFNNPKATTWCTQNSEVCTTTVNYDTGITSLNGISLTDALVNNASHTHYAAKAARNYDAARPTTSTSSWFLPSLGQWNLILKGLVAKKDGLSVPYSGSIPRYSKADPESGDPKMLSSNLNSVFSSAGAAMLQHNDYWSCSENSSAGAWYMNINHGGASLYSKTSSASACVRAVLAF